MKRKNNFGMGFKTKDYVNHIANFIRQSLVKEGYSEDYKREEWDPTKRMKIIKNKNVE